MSAPQGWEGIFAPGEELLWQGRPAEGVRTSDFFGARLLFGAIFTAFSIGWITVAFRMGADESGGFDIFPLFGIPFVLVGLFLMVGYPYWDAYARSKTWYTLSSRAAYVATEFFGRRSLKRVPFSEMNILELEDNAPGTVWFKKELVVHRRHRTTSSGLHRRSTTTSEHKTGFRLVADARQVYRLIADRRDAG